jgi:hypothetical protein
MIGDDDNFNCWRFVLFQYRLKGISGLRDVAPPIIPFVIAYVGGSLMTLPPHKV